MWTTPKKHTKKRETLRNANQNKTTRRAGYKVFEPHPPVPQKHSEVKKPDEMLNKTKTITTIAIQKKAKEKKTSMNQLNWKGALRKPL